MLSVIIQKRGKARPPPSGWGPDPGTADPQGVFCFAADVAENRAEAGSVELRPGDPYFLPAWLWQIAGATRSAPALVLNFYTQSLSGAHPGYQASLQVLSALLRRDGRRQWRLPLFPAARTRVEALLAECAGECAALKPGRQAAAHIALPLCQSSSSSNGPLLSLNAIENEDEDA